MSKRVLGVVPAVEEFHVIVFILAGPDNLSAVVEASVSLVTIDTRLPLNITGTLGKKAAGTIGKGEGKVILKSALGNIRIR